jgi:hypothetical protein
VGLAGIMHVEADLLDAVGDIRAGECRVLENYSKSPEVSRIINRRPRLGRDLGLCVHWRQTRLAIHHASSLKNIKSKLTLSEEELMRLMLYRDSQKMMVEFEVLRGEFPLEDRYGLLQKCCTGWGDDNVINVKQQIYHICAAPKTNKKMSDLASAKPMEVMYVVNRLYQA